MRLQTYTAAALLERLCQGYDLSPKQSYDHFSQILKGDLSPIEISAFLTALKAKGESIDEIVGAVDALRTAALPFPCADALKQNHLIVDCAGTGGDGLHTVNISTAVAIVLGCTDIKVAKHGGRAVSSKCGTADLLDYLWR